MGLLHAAVLGFLSAPPGSANGIDTDVEVWLLQLVRYPSVYPIKFALAIGLLLGITGLLFHLLATGGDRGEAAHWWMRDASSPRKRGRIVVASLCVAGIVLGLLYAHVTQPTESTSNNFAAQANANRAKASVWAVSKTRVYYCPGSAGYGTTNPGKYMSLEQAKFEGYQPVSARPCFADQGVMRRESKR